MIEPETTFSETPIAHDEDAEFPFSLTDFLDIARMLRTDTGIVLEQSKMPMVYARLAKRLRALGLKSFRKYRTFVATKQGANERKYMLRALTTNITRFFREEHHFEHLKSQVLPQLIKDARRGARIRMWSAGCSTGEEPYSIAITLLSMMPDATEFNIKILATDIDTDVLGKAREGVYSEGSLGPIGTELRRRWLLPVEPVDGVELWRVHQDLRALITFRTANLTSAWPMKGPFQVIFCRNTVIYFEEAVRGQIWQKMASVLSPSGYLYVGHSERIAANIDSFHPVGLTVYSRDAGAPSPESRTHAPHFGELR